MFLDNVNILGFKFSVDSVSELLSQINSIKKDGEIIQLLNADSIVSKNQIYHAVNQAFLAFNRGENLAKDIGVEIVLRCSAQRQISKAFDILGLKEGFMNLYVVLINCGDYSKELNSIFNSDELIFNCDEKHIMEIYNISNDEIINSSVEDIIIDRITRLTVDF